MRRRRITGVGPQSDTSFWEATSACAIWVHTRLVCWQLYFSKQPCGGAVVCPVRDAAWAITETERHPDAALLQHTF